MALSSLLRTIIEEDPVETLQISASRTPGSGSSSPSNPSSPKAGRLHFLSTVTAVTDQNPPFEGECVPDIDLDSYLLRLVKYTVCSPNCFIVAIIYVDHLISRKAFRVSFKNVHRLLMATILLATKLFEDTIYNNTYYSHVGGVPLSEINRLELRLLKMLDFDLFINQSVFQSYQESFDNYMASFREKHRESASVGSGGLSFGNGSVRASTSSRVIRRAKSSIEANFFAASPERLHRQYSRSFSVLSLSSQA